MDAADLRLATAAALAAGLAAVLAALARRRPPHPRAEGGMGVWEHVAELRRRLLACAATALGGALAAFSLRAEPRGRLWVPVASVHDNLAAQAYRAMARHLVPADVRLVVLRPLDGFSAEFTLALAIGFALALPVLLQQAAAFLSPALRPRERRALRRALLPMALLFAAGAGLAYALLAPLLLETLYAYPAALGAEPYLLVGELVSFTLMLMLVFGLAFLAPLAMAALSRAGLVSAAAWLRAWRHAVVAILVLCAATTDGTLVTLALVSAPLVGLYFAGVGLAAWAQRKAGAPA